MTDEPPESQQPWPDDRQQPHHRRQAPDYEGSYAPRQPQSQPGYGGQPQDFYAPPRDPSGSSAARTQHQVPQRGRQQADPGDSVTQQPYQRSQADDDGAALPWTQPSYAEPPYQSMARLFEFGSDYGDFQPSQTMTHFRPPKSRKSKILLVTVAAVALATVAILAGFLGSSLAKPAASKSSAPAVVPPAAPASSPATVGVNGLQSWWASYGIPTSQQIGKTMEQLSTDATNAETTDDFSAVESDLTTAQGEIQAAQADPPVPDATLERLWNTALADYASGVSDMLNGVQNLDATEITQGAAEILAGNAPMNTLASDIVRLGS